MKAIISFVMQDIFFFLMSACLLFGALTIRVMLWMSFSQQVKRTKQSFDLVEESKEYIRRNER
jgi:hypothetical protein